MNFNPAPDVGRQDVKIFPRQRYLQIAEQVGDAILGGFIGAFHLHFGLSSHEQGIRLLNFLRRKIIKNFSFAYSEKRLAKYAKMVGGEEKYLPSYLKSWDHYEHTMKEIGAFDDPGKCWWLIRLSPHGTIELRIADTTEDLGKIQKITQTFCSLVKQGL